MALRTLLGLPLAAATSIRVAFVGNSYTYFNDLPSLFASLCDSVNITVEHSQVTPPGSSLFEKADLTTEMGKETQEMLKDPKGWDYVVLQEQSQTAGGGKDDDAGLGPGEAKERTVEKLRSFYAPLIVQANATAVMYATWGRANGDRSNAECCGFGDFHSMTRLTAEGYDEYADALAPGAVAVAPAGKAFGLVQGSDSSRFCCLYTHDVSDQGCVVNHEGQGGHPSLFGTFLVACVLYAAIFDKSPKDLDWAPSGLATEDIEAARQAAHDAVFDFAAGRRLQQQELILCPETVGVSHTTWAVPLAAGLAVGACGIMGICWWRRRRGRQPEPSQISLQPQPSPEVLGDKGDG